MTIASKLVLTTAAGLLLAILVLVVDRGDRASADAHSWRGGDGDAIRQLIMARGGTLRKRSKPLAAAFLIALLSVVWLFL
jgi:hypothetical protein